ncbi:hypothetical protein O3M35_008665 [Rhynocoris fuscipes]|uniref:Uncharacterized protein n=1 Tax=Rhynocoris fuscipes TaxID=488301 RepID=A0AAW1DCB0_9HEMI
MSNKVADMQQTDSRSESDFRQTVRPQSVPAFKLASARSVSETRYSKKSATPRSNTTATTDISSQGQQQRAVKYAFQSTQLPQTQNAYHRLSNSMVASAEASATTPNGAASTNSVGIGPMADKWAKTKANNQKAAQSKQFQSSSASNTSASSPTDSGIGVQKSRKNDNVLEIQQLEHSPNMGQKYRQLQYQHQQQQQQQQKSRPMEMIFTDSRTKRFDLRDLSSQAQPVRPTVLATGAISHDAGQMARSISPSQLQHHHQAAGYAVVNQQPPRAMSSSSGDEGFDEVSNGEEKQSRDKLSSEKVRLGCTPDDDEDTANIEGEDEETMWGRGEAMALDDPNCANLADIDQSPESTTPRLRSVLLTIEDPEFTTLAVMEQSATMLEDEVVPESPDLSCSSPSSVEPLPPPPNLAGTPGSPGTPTHATNSLSSDAKDRDFLIDDEIADQPGLVFDTEDRHLMRHDRRRSRDNLDLISGLADDISMLDTSRTIAKLAGEVSQALASVNGGQGGLQFTRGGNRHSDSVTSLNTLSPCESLASDDLIADFDRSDISAFDDLNEMDDVPLKSEILNQSDQVMKEWTSLLSSHPG